MTAAAPKAQIRAVRWIDFSIAIDSSFLVSAGPGVAAPEPLPIYALPRIDLPQPRERRPFQADSSAEAATVRLGYLFG
jgi:hypothetical protein